MCCIYGPSVCTSVYTFPTCGHDFGKHDMPSCFYCGYLEVIKWNSYFYKKMESLCVRLKQFLMNVNNEGFLLVG